MMFHVVLDVLSGMPNPGWSLGLDQSLALAAILSGLPVVDPATMPGPPDLGYRGFEISGFGGVCDIYRVFQGHVDACGRVMADDGRAVELWLLHSARDLLPSDLHAGLLAEFGG